MLVSAIIFSFSISAVAQIGPNDYRIGESRSVAWDYNDTNVPPATLMGFEVQFDAGVWVNTGVPIVQPTPTIVTYRYTIPTLPAGNHNAIVRACNAEGCSPPSNLLTWRIWGPVPNTPFNPRIIPNPQPVSGSQALNMAQSYAYLVTLDTLKQPQAVYLVNNYDGEIYPDGTLPYGDIMDYLDRQAHILITGR